MAGKVSISTTELRAQASQMKTGAAAAESIAAEVKKAFATLKSNAGFLSAGLTVAADVTEKRLASLGKSLQLGANVASESAKTFENMDSLLRKQMEGLSLGLSAMPASTQKVTQTILDKFNELKKKDKFKQGAAWGTGNGKSTWVGYYNKNGKKYYVGGYTCYAMACMMQIEIMGKLGKRLYNQKLSSVKAGDVLRYYKTTIDKNGKKHTTQHWIFIADIKDGVITLGEGNYHPKKGQPGIVNYRTITMEALAKKTKGYKYDILRV